MKSKILFMAGVALLIGVGVFAYDLYEENAKNVPQIAQQSQKSASSQNYDVENIINDALGKDTLSLKQTIAMLDLLKSAPKHGLARIETSQFDKIISQNKRLDEVQQQLLINETIALAHQLNGGRMNWKGARSDWDMRPKARDFLAEFNLAKENDKIQEWLLTLPHDSDAYKGLLVAREKYEGFVKAGGFVRLGENPSPALLRQRLAQEGYVALNAVNPNEFDASLKQQLAAFQSSHGIESPDGELGERTLAALEISAQDKLKQIDLNLERERWVPRGNPKTRIEANIPSQNLVYYENGVPKLEMNTIVGKLRTKTPSFATKARAIVLNPPWYVPRSIRSRYRVQPPGPNNALGRVKFDFDNKFSVFLHDTPDHSLFSARNRALSHGCVRLNKPKDLAAILLAPEGVTREEIDKITSTRKTTPFKLKTQTPVLLLYRTAYLGKDNLGREAVHFVKDIYEWDNLLENALLPQKAQMSQNDALGKASTDTFQNNGSQTIAIAAP